MNTPQFRNREARPTMKKGIWKDLVFQSDEEMSLDPVRSRIADDSFADVGFDICLVLIVMIPIRINQVGDVFDNCGLTPFVLCVSFSFRMYLLCIS